MRTGAARRSASVATAVAASRAPPPTHSSGRSAASSAVTAASSAPPAVAAAERTGVTSGVAGGTSAASRSVAISRYTGRVGAARADATAATAASATKSAHEPEVHRLHDRREHLRLARRLVQDAAVLAGPPQRGRDVGRDHQHGRARGPRLTHGAQGVRRARARRGQRDAEPAGRAREPVRRVRRGLLVPHAHEPDRRRAQRLPQREVVDARQPEGHLHTRPLELSDDDLRTRGHRCRTVPDVAGGYDKRVSAAVAAWRAAREPAAICFLPCGDCA